MFLSNKKTISLLIDPEKTSEPEQLTNLMHLASDHGVHNVFVGGSLVTNDKMDLVVRTIKSVFDGPVILFPGGINQLTSAADGILFLSLISGRNPEFLIGKQVLAAPLVKKMGLKVYPTGYLLIGETSSASYMSNTNPIPYNKIDIAATTALAGEMMGHQMIYMDAGSGAKKPISVDMIEEVHSVISIPLIVGGGIRSFDEAYSALEAGADMIVVGNSIEQQPLLLKEITGAVTAYNTSNVH
jgi:putative glycerol-1-phosphate prenyltransferase